MEEISSGIPNGSGQSDQLYNVCKIPSCLRDHTYYIALESIYLQPTLDADSENNTTRSLLQTETKQWWSNETLQGVESKEGNQNGSSLRVDKFNSHSDSDCLVVADGSLLKIYKPNKDEIGSHTLLETELDGAILQVETGKFTVGSEDRQVLVLQPQSYSIFKLQRKEGHTDAGDQNLLKALIKHSFTRRAHSLSFGPFGNIKTRDLICVQALDGSLSFFDQDTFLFMYIFSDVIIPGPVAYIASSDAFVICKSTWILEIHSYQQLREFSEMNVAQNKKNIPQWVYNAGEEISSVQIIQTSNNFSSIVALGERNLCCFQDNGLMKYMIKFDFIPVCFCAYLIGWYYEPGARLLVMVASDDSKLYIYEGTTLLWSCDLLQTAISISRCFLKSLPGGIATLSANGIVYVSYLGTEPDLNANAAPMVNDNTTAEQVQQELETVEESLQNILEGKEGAESEYPTIEEIIKIKADVGKPVQNLFQQFPQDNDEGLHLLMCPVVVILTCEDPSQVQSVQITYFCCPPFAFSETTVCLDNINGTEIIETQVFLSSEADITGTNVRILFTVSDSSGKINVLTREVTVPLSLYCYPFSIATEHAIKLHVQTNHPCIDFSEIFTDFSKEDILKYGSSNTITFAYRTTKKTIRLKTFSEYYYSIEANEIAAITSILEHLIMKLADHFTRNKKDFRFNIKLDEEVAKQIIHTFLKSIESHAKERIKLKSFEDELNVLQNQFTLVQKKLLVQYGSLPPGDCDPLEFLMKDTHKRLIKTVYEIIQCKETVCRASSTLSAIGRLIIFILKQSVSDTLKVKLIEEMLTLNSLYELYQEWEESVTQALSYILNNVFQKSEKDKEKLAPVTEQGILSHVNLKRFLKQIRIILDKMFLEARDDCEQYDEKTKENRVTRIEEFVEVL